MAAAPKKLSTNTININSGLSTSSTTYGTITTGTNQIYANSGTWVGGTFGGSGTFDVSDFLDGKSLNLEKLDEMSDERRKSTLSIIASLSTATDKNVRKLLLNTLESYSLLEEKDVMTRKAKIESITK